MSTLKQVQAEIASRMRHGDAFDTVEDEVINASALSEAEKAARLYGWSFVHWRRQRREAVSHIDRLIDGEASTARALGQVRVADSGLVG